MTTTVTLGLYSQAQDYSVNQDDTKNQAVLTLSDNSVKYYNTAALTDLSFDGNRLTVNLPAGSYTYDGNVSNIAFVKAADAGGEGQIDNTEGAVQMTEARGWQESAYIKFNLMEGAKSYHVYVKGGQYDDYTQIDGQLVRNYGSYGRADVVGLKAGTYSMKVVAVDGNGQEMAGTASQATGMQVRNYIREGFAFKGRSAGVGAYNNDGTLKSNAVVLYVTNSNFNTIQCTMNTGGKTLETRTGLGSIMQALEKGKETRPFCIRFIGEIKVGSVNSEQLMGEKSCLNLKGKTFGDEQHVTYEGIGDDATMNGIGFRFNRAGSIEVRNLAIMNHADDCFEFTQCMRIWVHNTDLFYGNAGSDSDQAKGDGTIDLKKGTSYCTFDNNHFWDCGKASLCGLSGENTADYATYHHNWFDHADSRMPRVRVKTIHIYNNYYDGVSKYGAGSTMGSSLFVERNYFRNAKFPMMISLQGNDVYAGSSKYDPNNYGTFSKESGGMIKAYNNVITGSTTSYWPYGATTLLTKGQMVSAASLGVDTQVHFDCYEVSNASDKVPAEVRSFSGGNSYNNFDTDGSIMYDYSPDSPADVPGAVSSYYGSGRMNHGDFSWTFNNATDDTDYGVNTKLKKALNEYKTSLVGIFGDDNASGGDEPGGDEPGGGGDEPGGGGDEPGGGEVSGGYIVCSFDSAPSNSLFSVGSSEYGDGKITYDGTYYKKGLKLNSKGTVTFTPAQDYMMTLILATAKSGRDVTINGEKTTVGGTENTEGKYYEMEPIALSKGTQYVITKGSAEGLLMLIILSEK